MGKQSVGARQMRRIISSAVKKDIEKFESPLAQINNITVNLPESESEVYSGETLNKNLNQVRTRKRPKRTRLQTSQVKLISNRLKDVKVNIPSEFQRKPRDLECYSRWKATECRLFLLYVGPVVMKNILVKEAYDNFLLLSVAIRILLQKNTAI
ncbi:unnamed protein product [Allacma fusca]|uniref:Uncharacterized protein n=1 Tax=Allacma fusca TaxID=39272 RepID=A0A8J2NV21_9HEXA|nr:unnamed protein product [Allacma fusca]